MSSKEVRINVRTTPQIKRDLEVAAELRGLTVSAVVNSAVVKVIREEKEREPAAFKAPAHRIAHLPIGDEMTDERKSKRKTG